MEIGPKKPYHHGDLRQTVIETAVDMLNEPGGSQFTLREVARRAGVSHAAPYKHFKDKAALLTEVALIGFDRLAAALGKPGLSLPSDPRKALYSGAHAYLAFGADNPNLYRLMFGGDLPRAGGVHVDQRSLRALQVVINLLVAGQQSGVFRVRPVQSQAAACWAQLHGLTMLMLDGLLAPEKIGEDAAVGAITTLLEGLSA